MSSPRPLSPKRDSLFNSRSASPKSRSPSRNSLLPVKLPKLGYRLTPSRVQAPAFAIYEDKPEEYAKYHLGVAQDANVLHDDKENVLQPKGAAASVPRTHRMVLGNLSIGDFPGHVACDGNGGKPSQLHTLYQPQNYNNELRSVHKFNHLPSFITPPRDAMRKILYLSTTNEDDDVEKRLVAKLCEIMKRKRSMSVGMNRGKAHLVTKNKFKILST